MATAKMNSRWDKREKKTEKLPDDLQQRCEFFRKKAEKLQMEKEELVLKNNDDYPFFKLVKATEMLLAEAGNDGRTRKRLADRARHMISLVETRWEEKESK